MDFTVAAKVPASHSEQLALPVPVTKNPAAQSTHAAPVSPLVLIPASHGTHADISVAPAADEEPAAQLLQLPVPAD